MFKPTWWGVEACKLGPKSEFKVTSMLYVISGLYTLFFHFLLCCHSKGHVVFFLTVQCWLSLLNCKLPVSLRVETDTYSSLPLGTMNVT